MTSLRELIDNLVNAELDNVTSYMDGGAPSSRKEAELQQELREARQAIEDALRALEAP